MEPLKQRQARTVPNPRQRPKRIYERDIWIFEVLAKMRFVTTGQLAKLYFNGSRDSANKTLRRLLDSGFVRVWSRGVSRDNVYSLTPVGLHLLEGRDVMDTLHVTIPQQLGSQNEHLLLINAVRIALIDELPDAGGTLSGWRSDWELRQPGQKGLVPDALFMVGWHGQKAQAHMLERMFP